MGSILFRIIRISQAQLKSNDLKNETVFPNFLFNFWNLHYILNILKVKMIVIAHVFPNLQTVKNFVRSFCKERRFRTRFDSQHVKSCQIIAKSSWERFYQVFFWWSGKLIWKMCPLVLREILEVFVNTLTGDDRYPVQDCENLTLPIQMELSEK